MEKKVDSVKHSHSWHCLLAQPAVLGAALSWISAGATCAHTPTVGFVNIAVCLEDTRRRRGEDGWQRLCGGRGQVGRVGVPELLATVGRGGPAACCSRSRHGQGDTSHHFQILVQILHPLLYKDT